MHVGDKTIQLDFKLINQYKLTLRSKRHWSNFNLRQGMNDPFKELKIKEYTRNYNNTLSTLIPIQNKILRRTILKLRNI